MMTYLFFDVLILIIPLCLSFEKRIQYYKKFPALILSILIVGNLYFFWDIVATSRGDWTFNDKYILSIKFWQIPIEEILFFIVVPYSCLFIYEVVCYFAQEREWRVPSWVFVTSIVILGALAYAHRRQDYSFSVLTLTAFCLSVFFLFFRNHLYSRRFWIFIGLTYIPFLIFNYILTSFPVVIYNPAAIWGIRFLTIPVEDFLYSLSMIFFYFLFYSYFKDAFARRPGSCNSSL